MMTKGKDFYGKDIAEIIEQACRDLGASREELDIEVLETGSAGIFGLCKKKAHIRVQRKATCRLEEVNVSLPVVPVARPLPTEEEQPTKEEQTTKEGARPLGNGASLAGADPEPETVFKEGRPSGNGHKRIKGATEEQQQGNETEVRRDEAPVEPPSAESLVAIQADLHHLLTLMGLPSTVQVVFVESTVQCKITGPHEGHIVGADGRTLDSLQYLLRKMVGRHLPDRVMLTLNAGDFRERRAEELQTRATELAEQVKLDGKTQAIPALNPSERRVVHMALQGDKTVRSRSVGEGLFKKVLIYKAGKGRRPVSKNYRGGQGGSPSDD